MLCSPPPLLQPRSFTLQLVVDHYFYFLGGSHSSFNLGKSMSLNSVDVISLVCCPRYRFFTHARYWHPLDVPEHRTPSQQGGSGSCYLNVSRYIQLPDLMSVSELLTGS